jgi:hypothetical protein
MDPSQGEGAQGECVIVCDCTNYQHEPNLSIKSYICWFVIPKLECAVLPAKGGDMENPID